MLRDRSSCRSAVATAAALAALGGAGCGAKTGLDAPDVVTPPDVVDLQDSPDVPIRRPARCYPTRVRTRVGSVTTLRPDTDVIAADGYDWMLRARPEGSLAMLFSDGRDTANITPDRAGEYEVHVAVRSQGGAPIDCTIEVVADPFDPRCPGYAITEPRIVAIPGGTTQVGYDIAWGLAHPVANADHGAIVSDDTDARVSAVVIESPARFSGDPLSVLAQSGARTEAEIQSALGAEAVLVGRSSTTHDGLPLRRSTLRIPMGPAVTPDALRDRVLQILAGLASPPEARVAHAPASAFYIEVATIVRPDPAREITIVAISPVAAFDDPTVVTAIRVNDLANATALARTGHGIDVRCHAVSSTRTLMADFLWLVDTSGSMNDDQERVGRTAERFFAEMSATGMDFRVGVFQAGSRSVMLERGGGVSGTAPFAWIPGTVGAGMPNPMGPRQMAWQVTDESYPGEPAPGAGNLRPFRVAGDDEEPVAAAVLVLEEFERRRAAGESNPEFLMRDGAAKVAFFVTDEPGTNDLTRFFARDPARWGSASNISQLTQNIARFFTSRGVVPFGMVQTDRNGAVRCPSPEGLPACVVTAAGGAYIPIEIASSREADRLFEAAMARVVDAVAGAASEFNLPTVPLSASLRARVDGRLVPRSRADGFDYEERSHALVFRGPTFRPRPGQQVRTAYFVWTGM
jgi:hypothetical protein